MKPRSLIIACVVATAALNLPAFASSAAPARTVTAPHPPTIPTVVSAGEDLNSESYKACKGPRRKDHPLPEPNIAPLLRASPFEMPARPAPTARAEAEVPRAPVATALVLYDSVPSATYGNIGLIYAIMLRNLLGHFNMTADLVPIEDYVTGKVESYPATFYMGSYYNNPIPSAFLSDVMTTQKTIVWFKYNLWELAWNSAYNFPQKFGLSFVDLHGMDAQPTATSPNPGFFDTVTYKTMQMTKYYAFDATTGVINADPDIGVTQVTDPAKAQSLVTISDSKSGAKAPYIVRSGNFWYVADMPLTYIGPRDRYLVLCDILHDMLGINHAVQHRAMVRLEDVSAIVDPASMKKLTDYLYKQKIPFSIATIPFYRDPLGWYNGGVSQEIHFAQATALQDSLRYATARGGSVLMHGYTHQYDSMPDLHTAVSADDFEFWNAVDNTPVAEDSFNWAASRLDAGKAELVGGGFTPFAWEAPHYQGSPLAYQAFANRMPNTYQRAVYYTSTTPDLNPLDPTHDFSAGQFFPYVIQSDYYNQRVIPENLGNIEYDISNIDPFSNVVYTWNDLLTNANYAMVVRDGFASFFFHPFWVEQSLAYLNAFQDFQSLIQGITFLGYQWVAASTL